MENPVDKRSRGKVFFTDDENLYLPAIVKTCGYDVKINYKKPIPDMLNTIQVYLPDYIVANITFPKFRLRMETLAKIKELLPSVKIIVTGEPFLTYNTNVTYENPFIDYVILGEPEYVLRDILNGVPDNEILGILYTDDNMQSVKNELRPYIENLDELPFPSDININKNGEVIIEVSRGCPYHCFYCLASVKNGIALRIRSPQSVLEEIKYNISNLGLKKFYLKSDVFNFDNEWIANLCNLIIDNGLKINWSCELIPKNLNEKLIKLMYKSGLRYCKIGVESGSDEILKKLDKDITLDEINQTLSLLKKYKIKTICFYIYGLPWETEDTAKQTAEYAVKLNSDDAVFNIAVPLPGTKFFVYSMLNKLFVAPPEYSDGEKLPLAKSHKLSRERIFELKKQAEASFYNRIKYILKTAVKKFFMR